MNGAIRNEIDRLGVTRICHFTPFRNLVHIASGNGLLSSTLLTEGEKQAFTPQDLGRWDGHPNHISCSVEYPNAWYYRQKAGNDRVFRTWVVITVDPNHLADDETRFCHRNASAARGQYIRDGIEGFLGMYERSVVGAGGNIYERTAEHLQPCPTDNQAEVLVSRFIPIEDVQTIVLRSDAEASEVYVGLDQIGGHLERFTFAVVPEFFDAWALKTAISRGVRPEEPIWRP